MPHLGITNGGAGAWCNGQILAIAVWWMKTGDDRNPVVSVRFVCGCKRGHIDDLNWRGFVHKSGKNCQRPLWLEERGTSGDITDTIGICDCGEERPLYEALGINTSALGQCQGRRPWDVPGGTTVWPLEPAWTSPEYPGFGRPRKPKLRPGQRRTMEQRGDELPDEAWREITVAQGSQGPRTYRFSAQRVRATRRRKPGEELWAVWRRNLDGSEPRYYRSNAPEDTTLETLAYVGGSRWRIETEFETEKGDVGLDEYETRAGQDSTLAKSAMRLTDFLCARLVTRTFPSC